MTHFPDKPHDGQQLVVENEEGVVIYTYDEGANSWNYKEYGHVGREHVTFTDQVLVRENTAHEEVGSALADPAELKTQKEVNWYLDEKFGQGGGGVDYATKAELEALQAQVDNLSGLLIQARYEQGKGISTRPGEFVCVANDTQQNRFSQGTELRLYESDLDQKAPALTRVIVGDYINIVESTTGASCQLHVTHSAGIVIRYDYMVGTLDRISDRVPYEFRISGQG